ncbi:response regulator transcription factor [Alteromonas sp. RKMC-009]|uniref:response regulator transcription factor n=1 Tax=Alteromonas sp. RKMC-009 TaxID=2267264 RepID=UPI000C5A18D3|nr:response regulator transcription factor [Alteromonas sp. RKMC-009]AYA63422.1 response regulator transcription factor [Alteromonas sp. RKMC-009]MBT82770.1 hypothetical protein [Alteromonadaceae bacterium]
MKFFVLGESLKEYAPLSDAIAWHEVSFSLAADGGICWVDTRETDWLRFVRESSVLGVHPVVISHAPDIKEMQRSLVVGGRGYCNGTELIRHCNEIASAVMAGGMWIPGGLVTAMVHRLSEHPDYEFKEAQTEVLTEREKEVLRLLLDGDSNQDMADKLNITVRTVKEHMSSILKKYRVKDRVALLLKIGQFKRTAL